MAFTMWNILLGKLCNVLPTKTQKNQFSLLDVKEFKIEDK